MLQLVLLMLAVCLLPGRAAVVPMVVASAQLHRWSLAHQAMTGMAINLWHLTRLPCPDPFLGVQTG